MNFQARTRDFMQRHGLGRTPQTHALDVVAEIGEVAKVLLEASDYGQSPPKPSSNMTDELGDTFYSLIALAESLDVDLEAALERALEKYRTRLAAQGHPGSVDSCSS